MNHQLIAIKSSSDFFRSQSYFLSLSMKTITENGKKFHLVPAEDFTRMQETLEIQSDVAAYDTAKARSALRLEFRSWIFVFPQSSDHPNF